MNVENLKLRFADAGLALVISKNPIVPVGTGVMAEANKLAFQLDIRRKNQKDPHSEHFIVYPGADDNLAVVQGTDGKIQQLVLMVKEPGGRVFWEQAPAFTIKHQKARHGEDWLTQFAQEHRVKISDIKKDGDAYWVRRKIPERKRHFLMGRDERQLFMCQLSRPCTTVQQAHDSLKAPTVRMFEGKARGRTVRQGEWFFLNLEYSELEQINEAIKRGSLILRRKVNIGGEFGHRGKPHVADELIVTDSVHGGPGSDARVGGSVFVRGAVRHADHKTVKFSQWHRVVKNVESNAGQSAFGGRWID